ncbi:MAG TPA: glycoside hydrolase family 31 protein, partial [Anaerolineales bacterium]|nr:glycoside hydrolase family 31 protein [Anaerolineales bacterium]
PGLGIVDFTNPAARQWFSNKLNALLDMGVDAFKTDFGERIPTEVKYHSGADPVKMHNYYAFLYNQTVFDTLRARTPYPVVFARSATAGSQQFPVHWGGDCESTFEAMAESLRGGLSLGLSGFGFWSHDIGGFEGRPPAEIYKRWVAFGLLSSHSRLHGSGSYRVPWLYDEEAVDVLRFFTQLKCRLMPYLFAKALEAHEKGTPVMRAMLLEFPDDPTCETLDRQYMLGDALLVAPVFSADGEVTYYVPHGFWTHYLTGAQIKGPAWVRETHGFFSLPLLVRPNTLLAHGAHATRPDYDYLDSLTLEVYELTYGEKTVDVPTQTGDATTRFVVSHLGNQFSARCEGDARHWKVLFVGIQGDFTVEGGTAERTPRGILASVGESSRSVTLTF